MTGLFALFAFDLSFKSKQSKQSCHPARKKQKKQNEHKNRLVWISGDLKDLDFEAMKQNVDFCVQFAFFAFFLHADRTVCFFCF